MSIKKQGHTGIRKMVQTIANSRVKVNRWDKTTIKKIIGQVRMTVSALCRSLRKECMSSKTTRRPNSHG